ncbi:MAG TPA: hypothetical protein VGB92_25950 [Longimicrobium sp.]|jgi:hypothetical protein
MEATMLAWLCGVGVDEVHRSVRVLGLRFSATYLMSLRNMARIAYHLGTVVEQRRATGTPPAGRFLAKVRYRDEGRDYVMLCGLSPGNTVVQWWEDGAYRTGWGIELAGEVLRLDAARVTSWLIPVSAVHA